MDYNIQYNLYKMKNIIASIFAAVVLTSCGNESTVEETVIDTTTVVTEEDTLVTEEVVETPGEEATAE